MFNLRGLALGPGTPYIVEQLHGLAGPPELRTDDTDRDGDDGTVPGRDYYGPRVIDLTVAICGDTPEGLAQAADLFWRAVRRASPDPAVFTWELPGQSRRWSHVHPRRADTSMDLWHGGTIRADVQLVAHDPRMHAEQEQSAVWAIPDGQTSAQDTFEVGGNYGSRPAIYIDGPARNPRITSVTEDRAIRVDIDVPVGATLAIDVAARRVLLDAAPRFDVVRADNEWFELQPGPNTLIYSRASSGLTGASSPITVTWHDAWIA